MIITDMSKDQIRTIIQDRIQEENGHWMWTGYCDKNGYPVVQLRICVGVWERYYAHRVMYWLDNDLPDDLKVCHTCDIPTCINPVHLFLGTDQDNHTDKTNKGRQSKGETHGGHKLTDDIVIGLRNGSIKVSQQLSNELGVSASHLYRVRKGTMWTHL